MTRQSNLTDIAFLNSHSCSPKRCGAALTGLLGLFFVFAQIMTATSAFGQDYILTMAVLINSQNSTGYNTDQQNPGEFQRFAERYLEHLQVPYEVFDVATQSPPDLSNRQLILSGHRGLNLSSAWRSAITNAVSAGVGFVNVDHAPDVGQQSHIQDIFGATGSTIGTADSFITIAEEVLQDGASPHFIAALQRRFLGDPPGDLVYSFHRDAGGVLQTIMSTVLTGASGTVIASVGDDPLILATTFGSGRAVHFGTLEYLRADRFGFLRGVDDLFWRSLVWAARKPFVVRGFPRLWAVQMDDTLAGWIFRVRDLYNTSLTGGRASDGTGGPWRVTGYVFTDDLPSGSGERDAVIADITDGNLQLSPHSRGADYGSLYWQTPSGEQLNDATWLMTLSDMDAWMIGNGGEDEIPFISRSMVPHFWNLSDITGSDLWNTLGISYITEIQRPGIDFYAKTQSDRLRLRPFRLYELPPSSSPDENHPIYIADDYTVNSRTGLPPQTFFNFTTQIIDLSRYDRQDLAWPNNDRPVQESVDQFQYYTWRLWSSLAPVQIYTHDGSGNMILASDAQRQEVVQQVSAWLNARGVRHIFMEDLGDYMYARTGSVLTGAEATNGNVTLTFTGDAATPDNDRLTTEALVFSGDGEGVPLEIPGFIGGSTMTLAIPPAGNPVPAIASINPTSAQVGGPAFILTVDGSGFMTDSVVRWNGADRPTTFNSSNQLEAAIPATDLNEGGTAAVTVFNPAPGGGTSNSQTFSITVVPSNSFVDDFNRPDNAVLGNGWVEKTAAAFALASNGVSKAVTSSDFRNNLVYRPVDENVLDTEARVEVRFTSLPLGYPQVFVRGQTETIANAGVLDGYLLFIDNDVGRALLSRMENGAFNVLAQLSLNPLLNTADTFRLRLRATGTNPVALEAYVERLSDTNWTVIGQVMINDTATTRFTTAGTVGFSGHVEGGRYIYDNFTRLTFGASTGNPVPTISDLVPDSAQTGGPAFTLTVNGNGFVTDSVVRWNGADRTTTFVSTTQLQTAISATDIAAAGTAAVTVFNPLPGGGTSNSQNFSIVSPPASTFVDDFNRADDAVLGNGWTEKTAAAFALAGDQVSKAATSSIWSNNLVYRPGAENMLDGEASVEVRFTSLPPGYPQVFVRGQTATIANAGVLDGYLLFIDNATNRALLDRIEGGAFVPLAQITINPILNTTDIYRLRLRATGTNPVALEAYVERLSDTNWTVIGQTLFNDSAATRFTTAGSVGFSGHVEGGIYTFDNFTRLNLD